MPIRRTTMEVWQTGFVVGLCCGLAWLTPDRAAAQAALAQAPQNPLMQPQPAPGGWVAPFVDLAGRWQLDVTGEILAFALVPGTAEFAAAGPDFSARMVTLPSGRVRLDLTAEGGPVTTEGDHIVDGPPGHERYTIVFDPPPGDSRSITITRLD